jgi:RES domain-containing protein
MMRRVYRITKTRNVYDLSGTGAAKFGGRWHPKGTYVFYAASSPALAMLEWLAHANTGSIDESYSLSTITIPDQAIDKLPLTVLPLHWKKVPAPAALADIGKKLVVDGRFLGIEVPSVLVPYDYLLVINVQHPLMKQVKIDMIEEIFNDKRIIAGQTK